MKEPDQYNQPKGDAFLIATVLDPSSGREAKQEASVQLYERYFDILKFYVINKFGLCTEDAEDMAQNVLMKVLVTKKYTFTPNGSGSFQSWIFTVTKNATINFLQLSESKNSSLEDVVEYLGDLPGKDKGISFQLESVSFEEMCIKSQLSKLETEVINLNFEHGLPPRDIAQLLYLQPKKVTRTLHKARQKLRVYLDRFPV